MKVYRATYLRIEQHQLAQDNNQPNPELSWKLIQIYHNKFQPIVYNGDDDVNPNNFDNDSNGEDCFDGEEVAGAVDIASPSLADDVEEEEEEPNDGVKENSAAELVKTMSDCLGTRKKELGLEIVNKRSTVIHNSTNNQLPHIGMRVKNSTSNEFNNEELKPLETFSILNFMLINPAYYDIRNLTRTTNEHKNNSRSVERSKESDIFESPGALPDIIVCWIDQHEVQNGEGFKRLQLLIIELIRCRIFYPHAYVRQLIVSRIMDNSGPLVDLDRRKRHYKILKQLPEPYIRDALEEEQITEVVLLNATPVYSNERLLVL
ncbi:Mediator of RNA polymerase II transcription subunit 12 [Camellia lanceoleosa]|uniref:Mediator of RNA polymerase II transcription subunit 12 n=1 Tax=Camellia lanceoleosa TaxID=1840588 RepID=A0ACC0FLB9_9ERIC|nr:Mediator of RNA polymerase II transcription subunit 12 [Camellia lanceoleosa]